MGRKRQIKVVPFAKRIQIENTRHSSGLGVNVKNINSIHPDEWPDDSSGTRQGVFVYISVDYKQT